MSNLTMQNPFYGYGTIVLGQRLVGRDHEIRRFTSYLEEEVICFIEWLERGEHFISPPDIEIRLFHHHKARRLEL